MPKSADRVHREVVSYVRRSARMNASQLRAWQTLADRWVVPVPARATSTSIAEDAAVDWPAAFGRTAPLIVEIGPGRGESLVALAEQRPEVDIVAFEVFEPAVASALARAARHGVTNVRFVIANGAEGLDRLFGPGQVHELWTFFPDPWHKARHHKRRLIGPDLADLAASRLEPAGRWRLATDWADYADHMRETLDAHPLLVNEHGGWAPRWPARPVTKYEARGVDAGRTIRDLTYRRRP